MSSLSSLIFIFRYLFIYSRDSYKGKIGKSKPADDGEGRDAFEEEKQEKEMKRARFGVSDDEMEEEDEEEREVRVYCKTHTWDDTLH